MAQIGAKVQRRNNFKDLFWQTYRSSNFDAPMLFCVLANPAVEVGKGNQRRAAAEVRRGDNELKAVVQ